MYNTDKMLYMYKDRRRFITFEKHTTNDAKLYGDSTQAHETGGIRVLDSNLFLFYLYMYELHAFYTINVCLTVMTHN